MWKEPVVAQFEKLSRNLAGGTEENQEKHSDGSRDLNSGPAEYEGVLDPV
jgi:hypothetical protein